jgi:hypothetical protein
VLLNSCVGKMPFGTTLFRGRAWPDRGWETHLDGLADFAGHSLKDGAPEIPQVTVQDLYLSVW